MIDELVLKLKEKFDSQDWFVEGYIKANSDLIIIANIVCNIQLVEIRIQYSFEEWTISSTDVPLEVMEIVLGCINDVESKCGGDNG